MIKIRFNKLRQQKRPIKYKKTGNRAQMTSILMLILEAMAKT
jgi:hypothetical protein